MKAPCKAIIEQVSLSESEQKWIDEAFSPIEVEANQDLILAGHQSVRELYFVESGCLRLYSLDENGAVHNLQFAIEGHWITDLNAFQKGSTALFGIAALEEGQLWKISKEDLENLYLKIKPLERYFRILIQNAYQNALIRTQMQLQGSARNRWNYFQSNFPQLVDRIKQYHIASFIGIKPQSLSRLKAQKPH